MWQELDHLVEELEKISVVNLLQNRSIISLIGNVQRSSLILEKVCVLAWFPFPFFPFSVKPSHVYMTYFHIRRSVFLRRKESMSRWSLKERLRLVWHFFWFSMLHSIILCGFWLLCPSSAWQVNISLVVHDSEAKECVRSFHSAFFEIGNGYSSEVDSDQHLHLDSSLQLQVN